MTQGILTDLGEEYVTKNGLVATYEVGIYNDAEDQIGDTDDLADITSEPTNGNYARQSSAFSARDDAGAWGVDNDSQLQFDFTDTAATDEVDSFFFVINFQAVDTGDGSPTDHLVATGAMAQTRDLGTTATITINAGEANINLD